jgi:hypothetical protein
MFFLNTSLRKKRRSIKEGILGLQWFKLAVAVSNRQSTGAPLSLPLDSSDFVPVIYLLFIYTKEEKRWWGTRGSGASHRREANRGGAGAGELLRACCL